MWSKWSEPSKAQCATPSWLLRTWLCGAGVTARTQHMSRVTNKCNNCKETWMVTKYDLCYCLPCLPSSDARRALKNDCIANIVRFRWSYLMHMVCESLPFCRIWSRLKAKLKVTIVQQGPAVVDKLVNNTSILLEYYRSRKCKIVLYFIAVIPPGDGSSFYLTSSLKFHFNRYIRTCVRNRARYGCELLLLYFHGDHEVYIFRCSTWHHSVCSFHRICERSVSWTLWNPWSTRTLRFP